MIKKILFFILFLSGTALNAQQGFWQKHKIVMLFSSQCPHCQNMGPVVSRFLAKTALPFKGLSIDGQGVYGVASYERVSPDFIKAAFNERDVVYPALFIIENETLRLYPLAIGEISEEDLGARINILTPKIIQFERGGRS